MTDPSIRLIQRFRSRGVLVDTNILLLHFVGTLDPELIPRFKRTNQFTVDDYHLLRRILDRFTCIVTTPNVLTEVSNLCGQLGEPRKTECFREFGKGIQTLDEKYVQSTTATQEETFPKLGLTDSGILHLAQGAYLVLTDDFTLYQLLENASIAVLNFNHLRRIELA
ncbi:MAG: hypothetical protein HQ567_23125 [Candidatus Nealsonbacteria bacterium]|nr:hypothetical protein [Candidatus Nealsonbacteria bacterium]